MNKEVADEIGKKLLEWLNSGEAFLSGQIPDVVQQLLRYKMFESIVDALFGAVLLAVAYLVFKRGMKLAGKFDSEPAGWICFLIAAGTGLLGFILFGSNIEQIIKIHFAPKVFLLEYAKGLIK